jgi:transposase, IS5 family
MTQSGFFDLDNRYESISKLGDPLEVLEQAIPWETFRPVMSKALHKFKKNNAGRKSYDSVFMFKILVLQSLNNLSDDQTEFMIKDRLSFMRFLGLDFEDTVSGAKTLLFFRDTLSNKNVIDKLFHRFNRYLDREGLFGSGIISGAAYCRWRVLW